jgi:hypothetical protein
MPDTKVHKLGIQLKLERTGNEVKATASVGLPDGCYHAGDLRLGLPPGTMGIPENEYLTFTVAHDEGKICPENFQTVAKTINFNASSGKRSATAFVTVNGKVAGEATQVVP